MQFNFLEFLHACLNLLNRNSSVLNIDYLITLNYNSNSKIKLEENLKKTKNCNDCTFKKYIL